MREEVLTMLLEAVYHRPKQNWAYAYDERTIHVRLRTKKADVDRITVYYGDKFECWQGFEKTVSVQMVRTYEDELFDYWQAETSPPYRRLCYVFKLEAGKDQIWMSEHGFDPEAPTPTKGWFEFPFLNPVDVFAPPAWVKDAIFYQIFPDRFANGDRDNDPENVEPWGGKPTPTNFFGGDLQGVIDHIDYLSDLGITAIYFTPIFEATTNHKYDTIDYMKVDPSFGTNEKLKQLVDICHSRGIRVLLDAVFNHSGYMFKPFVDVKNNGAASNYKDWFHIRSFPLEVVDGIPTFDTFAFTDMMPKLNTENDEVKKYLLQVAKYWIEEVGIDGWRLDVANEVDHSFWREFRKTVKSVAPDAYILGELFHDGMMWLQGDQFDAVMNYPFTNAMIDFFAQDNQDGLSFAHAIQHQLARYPLQANEVMFNLLDSHDTARLLTLCGGDKRKMQLAALFQFTFLGTPCLYYGDEVGLDGDNDPDCRKCMEWDTAQQDRELHAFYKGIIGLRKSFSALRSGSFRFIYAKEQDHVIAYERADEQSRWIIVLNRSKDRCVVHLPVSEQWQEVMLQKNIGGFVYGDTLSAEGRSLKVDVEGYSSRIFVAPR